MLSCQRPKLKKEHTSRREAKYLSESINKENGRLQNELVQMRSDTKLSVSRISADVSTPVTLFIGR